MVVRGSRVSASLSMVMRRTKDVGSEEKDLKASDRAEEGVMPDRIVLGKWDGWRGLLRLAMDRLLFVKRPQQVYQAEGHARGNDFPLPKAASNFLSQVPL